MLSLVEALRCINCGSPLRFEPLEAERANGLLRCACDRTYPVIAGVPRLLPDGLAGSLRAEHPHFFAEHAHLLPGASSEDLSDTGRTQRAFGDEWRRFPELHAAHARIFDWYFEGPAPLRWTGMCVLDAGCGMGRWLHFARRAGADVVGMDLSEAIDVAAAREGGAFVQADLRRPPFPSDSFDLVYSLGVLHHLEDPQEGMKALARLVRPGGELRIYVYRSLAAESWPRRFLFGLVAALRRLTTRLPYPAVQLVAWLLAVVSSALFIWPHRLLRSTPWGWLTRPLPLIHYADVPFRMLVAEQFDRLVAPIEGRYTAEEVREWFAEIGFELTALLPGLGWRAIGHRPKPAP